MKTTADGVLKDAVSRLGIEWGIVLGSGLGILAEAAEGMESFSFADFPELPAPKVEGHAGRFLVARFAGVPVLLAMGRSHLYEGHSARDVTAGIRLMAASGVTRLILTNAAGTLNPAHAPGQWMQIADHINLTGTSPLIGSPAFVDMSEVYSRRLRAHFASAAQAQGITLHEGVYAGVIGPQYETPAEIRMLSRLGADAVGMSTVLEAIQARALGMEVAGFSCLTNWAAGLSETPLSHAEVLERGRSAGGKFLALLQHAFGTQS